MARMQSSLAKVFGPDLVVFERVVNYSHSRSQQGSVLEREDIARKTADTVLIPSHMYGISKTETLLKSRKSWNGQEETQ